MSGLPIHTSHPFHFIMWNICIYFSCIHISHSLVPFKAPGVLIYLLGWRGGRIGCRVGGLTCRNLCDVECRCPGGETRPTWQMNTVKLYNHSLQWWLVYIKHTTTHTQIFMQGHFLFNVAITMLILNSLWISFPIYLYPTQCWGVVIIEITICFREGLKKSMEISILSMTPPQKN